MNCLADAICLRCSMWVSVPAFTGGFALLRNPRLFNLASESRIYRVDLVFQDLSACAEMQQLLVLGGWTEQRSVLRGLLAAGMLLPQTGGKM